MASIVLGSTLYNATTLVASGLQRQAYGVVWAGMRRLRRAQLTRCDPGAPIASNFRNRRATSAQLSKIVAR